jgi:hypothetical protein
MPVNIYSHGEAMMPELLLNVGRAIMVHKQKTCVCVPQVVRTPKPDFGKSAGSLYTPLHHTLRDLRENIANRFPLSKCFLPELQNVTLQVHKSVFRQVDQPLTALRKAVLSMPDCFHDHILAVLHIQMVPMHG